MHLVEPDGRVLLGPSLGRVDVKGQTIEQAETSIQKRVAAVHARAVARSKEGSPTSRQRASGMAHVLDHAVVQVSAFGHAVRWWPAEPRMPYRVAPNDRLDVTVTWVEEPIEGEFIVDRDGMVSLGPPYGKVKVAGLSLVGAEKAVASKIKKTDADADVSVTLSGWETDRYLPVGQDSRK